ncbi:DUF3558 domain-containing protein [Actinokineospora diospyrosa]|uniref:DUF3558 domain-containing protein n=1 Tax=Actinokineospora diospyrosa TaxID=103728 RepID=A0ABT1II57_9PSEU|nr:DUF3558 domain-containing protein [Actinokineospora diospyrosa]MCP2271936.1 Protein of unknown function (DUF3558) [Actinokineospora diospyrosa]
MRRYMIVVGMVTAALLAACSEPGTPVAGSSGTPSPTTSDTDGASLKVKDPIEPGRFLAEPCAVLTRAQSTGLGWEAEGTPHKAGQKNASCDWDTKDLANYSFGWLDEYNQSITDTYRVFKDNSAYFEPISIDGYPAVFHSGTDNRQRGHCNLVVGIRDNLTFHVSALGGPGPEACETLREMATLAITNLKAG